jgi:tetratricopeptide (TPR) repeat protein
MRDRFGGFVVMTVLLVVLSGPCLAKDQWLRARSKNFVLVGNAKEGQIRDVAFRLEQFRAAFALLLSKNMVARPFSTIVMVFKNQEAFEPYKPLYKGATKDVSGYFQPGEDVDFIALTPESRSKNPYAVIFHEYTHVMANQVSGHVPLWFNEGLAEYYSMFDIAGKGTKIHLGKPISSHVLLLRERSLLPLSVLLSAGHDSTHYNEKDRRGVFYAQSWALVHYLVLGNDGRRRDQLMRYLTLLDSDQKPEERFALAFQVNYEAMEKELRSYLRSDRYPTQIVTLAEGLQVDRALAAESISEAEASYFLGDFLSHMDRQREAESYLRRALSLEPGHASASAALGILRVRQKRFAEARRELEEAVSGNPRNPLAHYYYALALIRDEESASPPQGDRLELIRTHLNKAIELAPTFAESYHMLASVNLASGEETDASLGLVQRAIRLAPARRGYLLTLAQLQLRKEDFQAARAAIGRLLASDPTPDLEAVAHSVLRQIDDIERYSLLRKSAEREAAASGAVADQTRRTGSRRTVAPAPAAPSPTRLPEAPPSRLPVAPPKPAPRKPCAPAFADVTNLPQISGRLLRLELAGKTAAFLIESGGATYRFLAPLSGAPCLFSCEMELGSGFELTEIDLPAVVYFQPTEGQSKYAGKAVAIELRRATPGQ